MAIKFKNCQIEKDGGGMYPCLSSFAGQVLVEVAVGATLGAKWPMEIDTAPLHFVKMIPRY